MKKQLLLSLVLSLFGGGIFSQRALAQDDCEHASPMMVVMLNGDHGAGKWYSVNIAMESVFPMSTPAGLEDDAITIYKDCDGNEAIKLSPNFYYLPAGAYKVFVKSELNGGMLMLMGTPTTNAPAGMYCFKPIELTTETWSQFQTPAKNSTTWYSIPVAYPAPVVVTARTEAMPFMHNDGIVTKVVTKLLDCEGGTNESNELTPNRAYAKGGQNLVAVTISDADFSNIGFSLDAMSAAGCNNHVDHATLMTLDTEMTYPDAFYTVDYRFVVPEDGNYRFINHGAEGTILRVGKIVENVCDFDTTPLSAVVDEGNVAEVAAAFKAGDLVVVESDAYDKLNDGQPYLKVVKGGESVGIIRTQKASREITVTENLNGSFSVSSYLLKEGVEVAVYDMGARKVYSQKAKAHAEDVQLNLNVRPGQYLVVVYGSNRSATARITVR